MRPACIQKPAGLFSLAGLLLGLALAVPTASAGGVAPVDSTAAIVPDLVISSYETAPPDPARTFIYAHAISASNPGSLADLSSLLPSITWQPQHCRHRAPWFLKKGMASEEAIPKITRTNF